ncbi:MAG: tartronate semialdehyde reductase [Symbiobacteriaceae bacterium]|jgi:2-hydroxy-3-oxopropionate reductase|nr:tartronate semialdehyde reductase [Symbiobacteriaceae bacterium]
MSKIGFIGLGIMGKPMARNLVKAGYELVVYDVNAAPMAELVETGKAEAAASPAEVAAKCDITLIMVPNSPHVKAAVLGANGAIEGAAPGKLVVDMSSIDPMVSREVGKALEAKGIFFMDAPVSGGEPKAIDGTLSFMVGGRQEDFDRAEPILKCMGASVVRCGDIGAGNVTKLANQIVVALNIAAVSEAMVLATKAGVDPELVYKAIRGGLAGSTVMDAKVPLALARKFNPGFRINLHIKDLANAISVGHEVGVPLPLTAQIMETMQALRVDGMGDLDHGAIIRHYEKLAQVEVKKQG